MRKHQGKIFVGGYQHILELSDTATFVWRQIDGVRTIREIGELVSVEYGVPVDEAVTDVAELCADLARDDVLLVDDDSPEANGAGT